MDPSSRLVSMWTTHRRQWRRFDAVSSIDVMADATWPFAVRGKEARLLECWHLDCYHRDRQGRPLEGALVAGDFHRPALGGARPGHRRGH